VRPLATRCLRKIMEIITSWVLPLLIYSGPLLTFGAVVKIYPSPKRRTIFWVALGLHVMAFIPFLVLFAVKSEDFLHSLILPAATGITTFVVGLVYLICVSASTNRDKPNKHNQNDAKKTARLL